MTVAPDQFSAAIFDNAGNVTFPTGLIIPADNAGTVYPSVSRSIRWIAEANGAVVADIIAFEDGSQTQTAWEAIRNPGVPPSASLMQRAFNGGGADQLATIVTTGGVQHQRTILNSAGQSNFLQTDVATGVAPTPIRSKIGTVVCTFGGVEGVVNVPMPFTPIGAIVTNNSYSGNSRIINVDALTGFTGLLQIVIETNIAVPAGTGFLISYLAWGS